MNQRSYYGRYRVTEFEAQLINILYLMGAAYQINAVKTCLYEIIGDTARLQKMMSWCSEATGEEKSIFVEEYSNWLLRKRLGTIKSVETAEWKAVLRTNVIPCNHLCGDLRSHWEKE